MQKVHIYFPPPAFLQVLSHWVHMAALEIELATFTCRDPEVASQLLSVASLLPTELLRSLKYNSVDGGYLSRIKTFTALYEIFINSSTTIKSHVTKIYRGGSRAGRRVSIFL